MWFRFFERFPEGDGSGVFWTILHGLEGQSGSDVLTVASVRRKPAEFPVLMVNRLLNAGVTSVGGVDLLDLLRSVAADPECAASVRESAAEYLEYQSRREE